MWAYPYLDPYPDYCCIVVQREGKEEQVVGYIVCAPDPVEYVRRLDKEYIPSQFRKRSWLHMNWGPGDRENKSEEKKARKLGTMPHYQVDAIVAHRYLIWSKHAQHICSSTFFRHTKVGGWRTKLIEALCQKLRSDGISGVHLRCNENYRAIKFYDRMKFIPWEGFEADGRKGLVTDKIANRTTDVSGLCLVKKL